MKTLLLAVLMLALPALGSAKMYEEPKSFSLADKSLQQVDRKEMKPIDPARLLQEDERRGKRRPRPAPQRFAVAEEAAFGLDNAGTWQDVPDGRLWRLRIHTPGAVSHNLGITRFELPRGAKLWVYDPAHEHVEGPYTQANRSQAGSLWTPVIEGDEIVVELFVPTNAGRASILISKVNKGYRGFTKVGLLGNSEGTCNIDVVCPEGNPWGDQIRAVTAYTINGTEACTGTMMNNTALDFTPYVLSANHCGVSTANAATIVAYWNFQASTCDTHGPGSTTSNQTGATFRAANAASDFALFQLNATPDPSFHVYYAGWDWSGIAPPGVACIHHPRADVKAISFANTPPVASGNFWMANWDVSRPGNTVAVTESGSSGSCIFASDTHRCIGQEFGGPSFCGASAGSLNDSYGRLSMSWTGGGTNATRLRNWLDPTNSGVMGLDGDPHITTLDGTHYDFQGAGEFVAFRAGDGVEVQVRQAPIPTAFTAADGYTGLATCVSLNTAVAAKVGARRVTYEPNLSGVPDPSGMQLRVDGKLTTLDAAGIDLGNGGRVARTGAPGGLQVAFPEGYTLAVTPDFWTSQGTWYLNVSIARTSAATAVSGGSPSSDATGGLAGAIPAGSWLPSLPDGSALGPKPAALHDRYVALYQKFGEAWRVAADKSLFDYAPGTSTDSFTNKSWPSENPPCTLPNTTPVRPASLAVARRVCASIEDRRARANCVFDVRVTGNRGFARTYLKHQRVRAGLTTIDLRSHREARGHGEYVTLAATVVPRTRGKRVPTGSVRFVVDGERSDDPVKLDARGRAAWKTAALKPGKHMVVATYIPSAGSPFASATSVEELHVTGKD
jgi:lysyl endopeptidase